MDLDRGCNDPADAIVCSGKEKAEYKSKTLSLAVHCITTLTYLCKLQVVTERMRSQLEAAEISFL